MDATNMDVTTFNMQRHVKSFCCLRSYMLPYPLCGLNELLIKPQVIYNN